MGAEARTERQAGPGLWPATLTIAGIAALGLLGPLAFLGGLIAPSPQITNLFFRHDLMVAPVGALALVAVRVLRRGPSPLWSLSPERTAALIIGAAALMAAVGWPTILHGYPFSMDEFMASFDAAIFREGGLFATAPAQWRPFRLGLQPQFSIIAPDGASWASSYLPVNAMALALFGGAANAGLAGAAWIVLAGLALWDIARRLWPERPDAAVVAVALLATSTQVLLAAMTPYAMTAHLALNLVWLALVLRDRWWTHLAAAVVAFAACGLHQVVFHPLFAAPFVLHMLLQRKWAAVAFHTLAYALIGLFWISYWRLFLPAGVAAVAGGGPSGLGVWLARLDVVARNFTPAAPGVMARNLFRFVTWQNPAAVSLALVAVWPAVRRGGTLRYAVLGIVLMLGVITAVMPYQGHGWGYRYLHGYIGVVCLLAAFAWVEMTERAPQRRPALTQGLVLLCLASVVLLLPLRGHQAREAMAPYREALAAIRRAPVDVVIVDTTDMMFGNDMVRNDPLLRNTPKIVDLIMLREPQVRALCAANSVAVFDRSSGSRIGRTIHTRRTLQILADNRAVMRAIGCDRRRVVVR